MPPVSDTLTRPIAVPPGLTVGDQGRAVESVERMLKAAGFDPGKVDSTFSNKTAAALKQFQASRGLPATGVADDRTRTHLKNVKQRVDAHHKDGFVGVGQKSGRILTMEKRLGALGYNVGRKDGIYDKDLAAAAAAFKADEKSLKRETGGTMTAGEQKVLAGRSQEIRHDAYRARVKPEGERRRLDALTQREVARPNDDATVGLGEGDHGRSVKNIQTHLRYAGFDPHKADGKFDERTGGMVKAFQKHSNLPVTGRVDDATWARLRKSALEAKGPASPAQKVGERSGAVMRTEKMLHSLGYHVGKVDGIFDARTLAGSRAFEKKVGGGGDHGAVGAHQLKLIEREYKASKGVTEAQLHAIMPSLPHSKVKHYTPLLNKAMHEAGITTEKRKEQFLAQLAHESVELRYFEEIASGAEYEGRADLGNTHPGDGVRYKGRGPIQLTGRSNYRAAGKALGLNLEAHPTLASRPDVGFRIAAWFWKSHGLNHLADRNDFLGITRTINGGTNGIDSRRMYLRRAQHVIH